MGQSSSNSRRNDYHRQNPSFPYSSPPPGPNQSATSSSHLPLPPLLPPPSQPPPPPPPRSNYSPTTSYYHQSSPWTCRPPYPQHYGPGRSGGWWTTPPPPPPINSPGMAGQPPALPPPPFVEQTKTVKNDVNVHKDSIRLVPDEQNLDHHLVSFTFDAMVDGRYLILLAIFLSKVDFNNSVTIYYFAKEGANATISSIYVDIYTPKGIPFLKGLGQTFIQPSGSGIDLGFFDLDELSKPLEGDAFPLVIYAKSCQPSPSEDVQGIQSSSPVHAQITQAVIEKGNDGNFKVKVIKQILWVEGERYELQEIFGLSPVEAETSGGDDDDMGKECVICLSEPRDTAVLPCRHMVSPQQAFFCFITNIVTR
ncbi:hypothetical protein BHM03_00032538 [Ensete ventricosum]|nr:hypothetical protein BHM03_00032538 [Ensete ventricosum]